MELKLFDPKDKKIYHDIEVCDKDTLIFKDRFNRCWQLIPINNPSVMMPFITKPLSYDKYEELSRMTGL